MVDLPVPEVKDNEVLIKVEDLLGIVIEWR